MPAAMTVAFAIFENALQLGHYLANEAVAIVCFVQKNENFRDNKSIGAAVSIAFAIGLTFGLGFGLFWFSSSLYDLGSFLMLWSFFHFAEWVFVATTSPKGLSTDSFLINHSDAFTKAIIASFVEYFLEWWLFPGLKGTWLMWVGILVTGAGQTLRTLAQFHARHNFTHIVQEQKREEHVLVDDGPYRYIRHPGYLGWFWWAVGTQILLFNPVCIVGYAYAAWLFFRERIQYEEELLASKEMFGDKYKEYRSKTPTYIPFIP